MKGKILFVTGLGVGYVLGTRAGRGRYNQLKAVWLKVWNNPQVQKQVDTAEAFVRDKAPDVAEFALDGAKKVVSSVTGKKATVRRAARKTPPASSASKSS